MTHCFVIIFYLMTSCQVKYDYKAMCCV